MAKPTGKLFSKYTFNREEYFLDEFFCTYPIAEFIRLVQNNLLPKNKKLKITHKDKVCYIPNMNFYSINNNKSKFLNAVKEELGIRCMPSQRVKRGKQQTWKLLRQNNIVRNPIHAELAPKWTLEEFLINIYKRIHKTNFKMMLNDYGWCVVTDDCKDGVFIPIEVFTCRRVQLKKLTHAVLEDLNVDLTQLKISQTIISCFTKKVFAANRPLQKLTQQFSSDAERLRRGKYSQIRLTLCRSRPHSLRMVLGCNSQLAPDEIAIDKDIWMHVFGPVDLLKNTDTRALIARYPITKASQVVCVKVRWWQNYFSGVSYPIQTVGMPLSLYPIENADNDGDTLQIFPLPKLSVQVEAEFLLSPRFNPIMNQCMAVAATHDILLYYFHKTGKNLNDVMCELFQIMCMTDQPLSKITEMYERIHREAIEATKKFPGVTIHHLIADRPTDILKTLIDSRATRFNLANFQQINKQIGALSFEGTALTENQRVVIPTSYFEGLSQADESLMYATASARGAVVLSKTGLGCSGQAQPHLQFCTENLRVNYLNQLETNSSKFIHNNPFDFLTIDTLSDNCIDIFFSHLRNKILN